MRSAILIAVMAVVTILLRFLPFLVFRKETPHAGDLLPEGCFAPCAAIWTS